MTIKKSVVAAEKRSAFIGSYRETYFLEAAQVVGIWLSCSDFYFISDSTEMSA